MAVQTKAIASIVWQVPNQPIVFANDPTHASRIEVRQHALGKSQQAILRTVLY